MPFWPFKKNVFSGKANRTIVEVDATVEVVPGELILRIKTHELNHQGTVIPILSFVSQGLSALGQKEMVISFENNAKIAQPYPTAVLDFYRTIHSLARQGRVVGVGEFTSFGSHFLSRKAVVYFNRPTEIPGLHLPDECLLVILLTKLEFEAVNDYGYLRVMSMLGNKYRYYPTPFWNDLSRPELPLAAVKKNTLLNRIGPSLNAIATATKDGSQINLELSRENFPLTDNSLSSIPATILLRLDAKADGCYTWSDKELAIISPYQDLADVTKICGCFLLLIPGQKDTFIQVLEDGFCVQTTNKQSAKFWQACINRRPFSLKSADSGLSFSTKWVDKIDEVEMEPVTDFYNPFDQKVYSARWGLIMPDTSIVEDGIVQMEFLRLLTDANTVSKNINQEILGAYSRQLSDKVVEIAYGQEGEKGRFILQVTLQPGKPPLVAVSAEKTLTDMAYFEEVRKAAMAVEGLQTKKEDIVFHLNFAIRTTLI